MKKRFFLFIVALVFALTLGACNLEQREVELGASVTFNPEMTEQTSQQVTVEITDKSLDLEDLEVTFLGLTPNVAEVSSEGLITAKRPGKAVFEVLVELGEAKKTFVLEIEVLEVKYSIFYELNGGQNSELNPTGFGESTLPVKLYGATKAGYKFAGWEYEGEVINALPVGTNQNVVLVATWEAVEYAISYELSGGKADAELPSSYTIEEEVVLPTASKAGYVFAGWYAGEEKVEKVEAGSTGELALTAKWEVVEYAISYDLAGGELAGTPADKFTVEDEVELPVPTKPEYRFIGWYANGVKVEKIAKGTTGNVELVAHWELDKYSISYDLAGGEVAGGGYVYDEANATQSFTITKYLNYDVNGLAVSLRDKANLTWWGHIALAKTEDPEVFEILQIANKSTGITVEFDYVIAWHSACTDTASKAVLDAILKASADYVGDYVVIKGVPAEASDAQMTAKTYEQSSLTYKDAFVTEYTQNDEVVFPVPTKLGYNFLGWYDGETKVEKVEKGSFGDLALVAKWEVVEYAIVLDAAGGESGVKQHTIQSLGEEFLADFNKYGEGSLTKESFFGNSTPVIKKAFANSEMLAKWNWLFVYMLEDLKATNPDKLSDGYLADTLTALEKLIAGDTAVMSASAAPGPNARTMIRSYMAGLMNLTKGSDANATFAAYVPDFSVEANRDALVAAANMKSLFRYTEDDEFDLPIPTKEGYEFLGWYDGETKVERIEKGSSGDLALVARWEEIDYKSYKISYDTQGGELAVKEYDYDEIVADFLADFNRLGSVSLTAQTFLSGSHPSVKTVFANADFLAKWNWLFVYMLEDLKAINPDRLSDEYLADTLTALEKLIAGDTAVMSASAAPGPNARTMIRSYMAGLMNLTKGSDANATFAAYVPDFSVEANQAAILAAVNKPLTYTVEDEVVLPTPTKEGYTFLGWYNGDVKLEKVEKGTTGELTLVAKWESEVEVEVESEIEYVLDGGVNAENAPATYVEGEGLATLPTPTKEGYKFLGWYIGENKVESISAETTGKVTLTAKWEENKPVTPEPPVEGSVLEVGAGKQYAELDAAVEAAKDGDTIKVYAGEYTLTLALTKNVKIVGPRADSKPQESTEAEAVINVAKDVAGNLAAKNIEFNGVHLKGEGGGAGIPGVYFQDGGNVENLVFKSCVVSDMNTFVKVYNGTSAMELVIEDCEIHTIGQFVVWAQASAITKVALYGNFVNGASCGAVANSAAALFRVRSGAVEAYNNYFVGDSSNAPGYFECSGSDSVVKYNTFESVTLFVHGTATHKVVFNENLYLNENHEVLSSAPATLKGTGVTADKVISKKRLGFKLAK